MFSFDGTNGANPLCGLVQGTDGLLYGTTYSGGISDMGTVFEMTEEPSPSPGPHVGGGILTTLHEFTSYSDGVRPEGLVQAADGNLYGTTIDGGINLQSPPYGGGGSVYQITTAGEFTNLFEFDGTNGAQGYGPLVQGTDGYLYGTTSWGWRNSGFPCGTIFRISTNGDFSSLYGFRGPDGSTPYDGLIQASDGSFYGMTANGYYWGTIFRITATGDFTNFFSFNGTNGANPFGGLVEDSDGNFYGTTMAGGSSFGDTNSANAQGFGTIFRLTRSGVLTTLFSFNGTNGAYPYGPLILASDGRFYGTTAEGGAYARFPDNQPGAAGYGTLFRITTNGEFTTLYSFDQTNGASPLAPLVEATNGTFYGTTDLGGAYNLGTVYCLTAPRPPRFFLPAAMTNECREPFGVIPGIANDLPDPLTAIWSMNQVPVQTNVIPPLTPLTFVSFQEPLPLGTNIVTLSVSNTFGDVTTAATTVMVVDTNPPVILMASADPAVLWPVNSKMVNVNVRAVVEDDCSPSTWKITNVQSLEPTFARYGRFDLWNITGDHTVSLRAEPGPRGKDRIYYVTLQATDESGNVSQPRVITVTVPRHRPQETTPD